MAAICKSQIISFALFLAMGRESMSYRAAVEVLCSGEDDGLILWHALGLVCPFSGNLDCGLDSLGAGVHRQDHVVPEHALHLLGPPGEHIIVECARGESDPLSLFAQRLHQFRMAMALVDRTVGRKEVDVVLSFRIPHVDALCAGEHHGEGVVVMGRILVLDLDCRAAGGCVVSRFA